MQTQYGCHKLKSHPINILIKKGRFGCDPLIVAELN